MKLLNAFSLNMLPEGQWDVRCRRIPFDHVQSYLGDPESYIGHEDTARVLADVLDDNRIVLNRVSVVLEPSESVIVAQFTGARLPAGATTLPEGAVITWWLISVYPVA